MWWASFVSTTKKILTKANAASFGVSGSSKAKDLIKRALSFNAAAKRKYHQTVDSDSDSSLEPLPKLKGKEEGQTQDDLEFVYQKFLIGKVNWKTCLSVGHEKKTYAIL